MTIDPRLKRIVAAQHYPLLFATISGAHLYGFGFPKPATKWMPQVTMCASRIVVRRQTRTLTCAASRIGGMLPLEKIVGLEVRDETVEQEMIVPPHPSPLPQGGDGGA